MIVCLMSFSFIEWTPVIDDRITQKVYRISLTDYGCKGKADIGFYFTNAFSGWLLSCTVWTFFTM